MQSMHNATVHYVAKYTAIFVHIPVPTVTDALQTPSGFFSNPVVSSVRLFYIIDGKYTFCCSVSISW